MNTLDAILTRRSCREFTDKPIKSETLHQLLEAAMSGPSCVNARDWSFVVVAAPEKLFALPETIVPHSIIALGYPEADLTAPRESRYEDDRVHFNQW